MRNTEYGIRITPGVADQELLRQTPSMSRNHIFRCTFMQSENINSELCVSVQWNFQVGSIRACPVTEEYPPVSKLRAGRPAQGEAKL